MGDQVFLNDLKHNLSGRVYNDKNLDSDNLESAYMSPRSREKLTGELSKVGMSDVAYMSPNALRTEKEEFNMINMSELLVTPQENQPLAMLSHPHVLKDTKQSDVTKPKSRIVQPNHESHLTLRERFKSHVSPDEVAVKSWRKSVEADSPESTYVEAEDAISFPTFRCVANKQATEESFAVYAVPTSSPTRDCAQVGTDESGRRQETVLAEESEYSSFVSVFVTDTEVQASPDTSPSHGRTPCHSSVLSEIEASVYLDLTGAQWNSDGNVMSDAGEPTSKDTGRALMGGTVSQHKVFGRRKERKDAAADENVNSAPPADDGTNVKLRQPRAGDELLPTKSRRPTSMPFSPPPEPPVDKPQAAGRPVVAQPPLRPGMRPLPPTPSFNINREQEKSLVVSQESGASENDHSAVNRSSSMPDDPPPLPPSLPSKAPPLPPLPPASSELSPLSSVLSATADAPPPLLPRTATSYAPKLPYRPPSPYLKSKLDSELPSASANIARRSTSSTSKLLDRYSTSKPTPNMSPSLSWLPPQVPLPSTPNETDKERSKRASNPTATPPLPRQPSSVDKGVRPARPLVKQNNQDPGNRDSFEALPPPKLPVPPPKPAYSKRLSAEAKPPVSLPTMPMIIGFQEQVKRVAKESPPKPAPKPHLLKPTTSKPKPLPKPSVKPLVVRKESCSKPVEKPVSRTLALASELTNKLRSSSLSESNGSSPAKPHLFLTSRSADENPSLKDPPVAASGNADKSNGVRDAQNRSLSRSPGIQKTAKDDTGDACLYSAIDDISIDGRDPELAAVSSLSPSKRPIFHVSPSPTVKVDSRPGSATPPLGSDKSKSLRQSSSSPPSSPSSSDSNRSPRTRRKLRPNVPPPPRPTQVSPQTSLEERGKPTPARPPPPSARNIHAAKLRKVANKLESEKTSVALVALASPKRVDAGTTIKNPPAVAQLQILEEQNNFESDYTAANDVLKEATYSVIPDVINDSSASANSEEASSASGVPTLPQKGTPKKKKISLNTFSNSVSMFKSRLRNKTRNNDVIEPGTDHTEQKIQVWVDDTMTDEAVYSGIDDFPPSNANFNASNNACLTSQWALTSRNEQEPECTYAQLDHERCSDDSSLSAERDL